LTSEASVVLTGIKIINGSSINVNGTAEKIPEAYVCIPFVMTIIGLLAVALKANRIGFGIGIITNFISLLMLLTYKLNTDNEVVLYRHDVIQIDYNLGYWTALILSFLTLIIMIYFFKVSNYKLKD
jgi:hypothetical protein